MRASWSPAGVTDQRIIPVDANAFVGPLINRDAIAAVGLPRSEYFIMFDDHEYTYRISRRFPSYLIPGATIIHFDSNSGRVEKPFETHWKNYYYYRNWVDFTRQNDGILAASLLTGRLICATTIKVALGWYRDPLYSYRTYCLGALHGLIGKFAQQRACSGRQSKLPKKGGWPRYRRVMFSPARRLGETIPCKESNLYC